MVIDTLFLDRDGVINKRNFGGYIMDKSEFSFLPHCIEALQLFSKKVSRIIVITNQQGIAKGLMTEAQLYDVHTFMLSELEKMQVKIDAIYFASNLKGTEPDYRKPNPFMGRKAKEDFPSILFEESLMVGDTDTDIQFGKNLGTKTALVRSEEKTSEKADFEVTNLLELYYKLYE